MIQKLDKYGNTSTDNGGVIIYDSFGNIKKVNKAIWGSITGTLVNQIDLINFLTTTYVPSNRTITINGTTYDLTSDRSWTISVPSLSPATASVLGGVKIGTGINVTVDGTISINDYQLPLLGTGFVKSTAGIISYDNSSYYLASNPNSFIDLTALSSTAVGLSYINTTGVFSLTSGYFIPTITSYNNTNWDNAYTDRYKWDGSSWAGFFASTGRTSLGLGSAALNNTSDFEVPLTFSTGLSRTGNTITNTITQYTDVLARSAQNTANTSTTGVLTSTDWNTFNNKQNALSLTSGFIPKATGTSTLNNSLIQDNGTTLGIGAISTLNRLTISDVILAGSGSLLGSLIDLQQTWNTTASPTAIKLNVTNLQSGGSAFLMDLQVNGITMFSVARDGTAISASGFRQNSFIAAGASSGLSMIFRGNNTGVNPGPGIITFGVNINNNINSNITAGILGNFDLLRLVDTTFQPPSGTGTFNSINIGNTINQSGGANGITRGLYVNPTLTSAFDYRAIEVTGGKLMFPSTITSTGVVGTQTIHKISGKVNAASGTTSLTVINNLVTTSSIVICQMGTNDATARITSSVEANGSFIINYVAPTAETVIKFFVIN